MQTDPGVQKFTFGNGSTLHLPLPSSQLLLDSSQPYYNYLLTDRQIHFTINPNDCLKPKVTWKQPPDINGSCVVEERKQSAIRCAANLVKRKQRYSEPAPDGSRILLSNKITAKPVCSWYNPNTCEYETVSGLNPLTQNCRNCCGSGSCRGNCGLPIKARLGYTRINKNWCNTTKTLTVGTSSSEQIAKKKQGAFQCPCPTPPTIPSTATCEERKQLEENYKRRSSRFCHPRPLHTGKLCGVSLELSALQKEACRVGCPENWEEITIRTRG